ncbi:HEAT repeat domain-containing protein [Cecembia sp.]|uniref:HEAT repeat domain-containing protein n=1 Tax=Cecembia sp. TaxID=1898110 RepID=UPI0025B840E4|nr:HEAT repeat domain-containing protein [Cecembia sp.]
MSEEINNLFLKLCDKDESDAYLFADKLAKINSEEVMQRLLDILKDNDIENSYLAARALSKMERRQEALDILLEVIHDKKNQHHNGGLVEMLENFDLSEKFVDIFRIYLFGNFKASLLAKSFLDTEEFNISPRILRKAEKHWNHFSHNSNPNEGDFQVKSIEAQEIINEIKEILAE